MYIYNRKYKFIPVCCYYLKWQKKFKDWAIEIEPNFYVELFSIIIISYIFFPTGCRSRELVPYTSHSSNTILLLYFDKWNVCFYLYICIWRKHFLTRIYFSFDATKMTFITTTFSCSSENKERGRLMYVTWPLHHFNGTFNVDLFIKG